MRMQRDSRSELAKTVEGQKEQLARYEKKLRDVVLAYKVLQAEKDALSTSLAALGASVQRQADADVPKEELKVVDNSDSANESNDDVVTLRRQLMTLTQTLATISGQKDTMTAGYQEEKRRLREENEEKMQRLRTQIEKQEKQIESISTQSQQWRSRLVAEQHDRDKEQDEHATLLQQLQRLLEAERIQRENCEHQLEEVRCESERRADQLSAAVDGQRLLQQRADQQAAQLTVLEGKAKERTTEDTTRGTRLLHEQMTQLKLEQRQRLGEEERRSAAAQTQLVAERSSSERRQRDLEARLTQLSEQLVATERGRSQDALTAAALRERCAQLQRDAPSERSSGLGTGPTGAGPAGAPRAPTDAVGRLLAELRLAVEHCPSRTDVEVVLREAGIRSVSDLMSSREAVGPVSSTESPSDVDETEKRYLLLKEEFDSYKLRVQTVFKNNASKEHSEAERWQLEASRLRGEVGRLAALEQRSERRRSERDDEAQRTIECLLGEQRRSAAEAEAATGREAQLEGELKRMRQRTVAMLVDKDRQIESLTPVMRAGGMDDSPLATIEQGAGCTPAAPLMFGTEVGMGVSELLDQPSAAGESSLLHYAEERARRDLQLARLRREKHGLEAAVRQLQQQAALQADQAAAQLQRLTGQVQEGQRGRARDTANLEYLKNVVHRYMVCESGTGRMRILNAIATILQFSTAEKTAVERRLHKGWWPGEKAG